MKRVVCLLAIALAGCSHTISVVTYNVENLCDGVADGAEYERYTPQQGWDREQFRARCAAIAEVLKRIRRGGPDVVVLQEVEHEGVVDVLCDDFLPAFGYAHRAVTHVPGSPINVAILSRFPIRRVRCHGVALPAARWASRHILEVDLEICGESLCLLAVHFKSKIGGARETESLRLAEGKALARLVDERVSRNPACDLLVAGDLNENYDEPARVGGAYATLFTPSSASEKPMSGSPASLYTPWQEWRVRGGSVAGSYAYRGEWLTHDHFLLAPGLLDERGLTYVPESFSVFAPSFVLSSDGLPRRSGGALGSAAIAPGYSDHLPIAICLRVAATANARVGVTGSP